MKQLLPIFACLLIIGCTYDKTTIPQPAHVHNVVPVGYRITVQDFTFTPQVVNCHVGDTLIWNWVSGGHTTTCNGVTGTSRPAGAASWDHPMNSASTVFKYVVGVNGTYTYICNIHGPFMNGTINVN